MTTISTDTDIIPTPTAARHVPVDPIGHYIDLFFEEEHRFCLQAKAVADALEAYQSVLESVHQNAALSFPTDLKNSYRHLNLIVNLYRFLSVNYFELKATPQPLTHGQKLEFILSVIKSNPFGARIRQLNDASRLYTALCDAIIPAIKDNTAYSPNARDVLSNFLSAPAQRLMRMKPSLDAVQAEYAKQKVTVPDSLKRSVLKLGELANAANQAQTLEDKKQRELCFQRAQTATITPAPSPNKYKRIKFDNPQQALQQFDGSERAASNSSTATHHEPPQVACVLNLFENRYAGEAPPPALELTGLLKLLQLSYFTPMERLQALEKAFGVIRTQASNNKETHYFFRKNFPYTQTQLQDIALLKRAYLTIIQQTTYNSNLAFEQYLKEQYPGGKKAEEVGGLLAFNRTTCRFFIKDETRSMRALENLKAGLGRRQLTL